MRAVPVLLKVMILGAEGRGFSLKPIPLTEETEDQSDSVSESQSLGCGPEMYGSCFFIRLVRQKKSPKARKATMKTTPAMIPPIATGERGWAPFEFAAALA